MKDTASDENPAARNEMIKFNAYFVQVAHRDNAFTTQLLDSEESVSVNCKKIGKDLYIANFKTQQEFSFHQEVPLKNNKTVKVLLPVLAKYNKRKLTKLSKLLENPETEDKFHILTQLPEVDKFLDLDELLEFFSIRREDMLPVLLDREVKGELKIINFNHLCVLSRRNFDTYRERLEEVLRESHLNAVQVLAFSEIEGHIKVPQSSIFFKYLVRLFVRAFGYKIKKDRLVFRRTAITETEKSRLEELSDGLKKERIVLFSHTNVQDITGLTERQALPFLQLMEELGEVIRLNDRFFILREELDRLLNKLRTYKRNQGEMIDIKAFRDMTKFTRRLMIPLLEYFDAHNITVRVENQRKILLGA